VHKNIVIDSKTVYFLEFYYYSVIGIAMYNDFESRKRKKERRFKKRRGCTRREETKG
jgi:hypothetical protein